MKNKRNIAILMGDPSGIGPELICKILNYNFLKKINIIIIGEKYIFDKYLKKQKNIKSINNFDHIEFKSTNKIFFDITKRKVRYPIGKANIKSGISVLKSIGIAVDLYNKRKIDGINFAPFNKTSLDLAGMKFKDELHYFKNKFKIKSYVCELNVLNDFWTARVTSHIPLKDVPKNITIKNILEPIKLVNKYLKKNGLKNRKR